MNRELLRFGLMVGALCVWSGPALGDVIITEPVGGNDVSADKCLNSTNGAGFVALGSIVLTEVATTDFTAGNNKTFILTLPSGWQFKSGLGAFLSPGAGTSVQQASQSGPTISRLLFQFRALPNSML